MTSRAPHPALPTLISHPTNKPRLGSKQLQITSAAQKSMRDVSSQSDTNSMNILVDEAPQLDNPALGQMRLAVANHPHESASTDSKMYEPISAQGQLPAADESNEASAPTQAVLPAKVLGLIESIPDKLAFLLEPNVDYEKQSCRKDLILGVIKHFHPGYTSPVRQPKKGFLIREYKQRVLPQIAPYLQWKVKQQELLEAAEAKAMTQDPGPLDLSGLNPNSASITTDAILDIIAERRPSIKLPLTMTKTAAIGFFHQCVCRPPPGGYPMPFTATPSPVPQPYHRLLTWDEIFFTLQCHCPVMFVPSDLLKPILLALYVQFVLDDIADESIFEGVHYFYRQV
ncbi:hypothetical protein PtB15_12B179 [Puccinia triticina]|nr:hypothetical protein PtB15_12B179 [Puccinia triticina]